MKINYSLNDKWNLVQGKIQKILTIKLKIAPEFSSNANASLRNETQERVGGGGDSMSVTTWGDVW